MDHLGLASLFARPFSPSWARCCSVAFSIYDIYYLIKVVSDDDGRNAESTMLHNLHHFPTAIDFLNLDKETVRFIFSSAFLAQIHVLDRWSLVNLVFLVLHHQGA